MKRGHENLMLKMKNSIYPKMLLIFSVTLVASYFTFTITGFDIIGGFSPGGGITDPTSPEIFGELPADEDGDGGATPETPVVSDNIEVSPTEFNINMLTSTNVERTITVKNNEASAKTFSISQTNLDSHVILGETSITLNPGETKEFNVVFVALNQTGIFTGTIKIGTKTIPVSLNVRDHLLLFDSEISVLNPLSLVRQGSDLRTRVRLIPMGDPDRLDVTLNYVIKDFEGNEYYFRSETLLIEKETILDRNFETGNLPPGRYVIGLELIYPNGVAPSSAQFNIVKGFPFAEIIYYIIIALIINSMLIVVLLINRLYKSPD
jgi:hypothetical protein